VLTSSIVSGNRAGNGKGGNIANGAVAANSAGPSTVSLIGSRLSYGQALWGGGIFNNGEYALTTVTLDASSSIRYNQGYSDGGGIYNFDNGGIELAGGAAVDSNSPNDRVDYVEPPPPARGAGVS
jgi:hypothetical protein